MRSYLLVCTLWLACLPGVARAEDAAGDWVGFMASGFKVIVHVEAAAGGYSGKLRTPNGNVTALDQVTSDGKHLHFAARKIELSYDGDWNGAKGVWAGTLTLGQAYPLDFRRAKPEDLAAQVVRRPQEDAIAAGPRPYSQRDVSITTPIAGVSLAGTYSIPDGQGPFPAVVLVSGTGRNTRDEDVNGHKVFLVLADALNRQGIAVFRYDKRGVAGSTGSFSMATTADFAADADAALNWLSTQPEVLSGKVGIIGHSEGGIIAPMVAAGSRKVAFVVTIAGPGLRGDKLFVLQAARVAAADGVPADYIERRKAFDEKLFAAALSSPDAKLAMERVKAVVDEGVRDKIVDAEQAKGLPASTITPWMRYFLANDPARTLKKIKVPILVLNGSLDLQVPPAENLPVIRQALKNNRQATVMELLGLNHLLQTARTGSPAEYAEIDETMSPAALRIITDWVKAR